jgi:hypothetical protein
VSPADAEVIELAVTLPLLVVVLWGVFALDERRMTDAQRARAWPAATRGLVVISPLFAPLWLVGVPLHFLRTRRNLRGIALALLWLIGVYAVVLLVDTAVAFALGAD